MEFNVLKFGGGLVKQFTSSIFVIEEDEFYCKKKKNDEDFKRYHISYLNEVYIQKQIKEKQEYVLIIDLNANFENNKKEKTLIKLADKEDSYGVISQIKKILNVKRLQYDINLFLFNYKERMLSILDNKNIINKFEEENKSNIDKIKKALKNNEYLAKNIEKISILFNEKLNNFVNLLNQNDFNANLIDEDTINKIKILLTNNFGELIGKKSNKNYEDLERFKKIYINLIKLYSQIKFAYILKKFKNYDKKYLLEKQKANKNIKNNINDKNIISNQENNEIKEEDGEEEINNINNENTSVDNIETRISKKKEQNEAYKSRILTALNSSTKMKDNLKNMILTQNKKLFFCLVCNNTILEKTLLDKANCNFDSKCTSRSFFYCKRCKIHFCTKCVIYQRGMKCFKNHKYFPKQVNPNDDIKCFLCNKSKMFPFYECKYCKEQICSECSDGVLVKQNTCNSCSNELIWKKSLFSQCDRCHQMIDCFYFCICCDYSICMNCSNLPKNKCGALHDIEKIEFDLDDKEKYNKGFSNNYIIRFDGKCSWCNITIGRTNMWACLRCSLFLCEKCYQKIYEKL